MFSSRHLIAAGCVGLLLLAAVPVTVASGQGGKAGADPDASSAVGSAHASSGIEVLDRPARRFKRSIAVHLTRVEARQARRQARRDRRQARRERLETRRQERLEAQAAAGVEGQTGSPGAGSAGDDIGAIGVDQSTLDAIAACESNGDPGAVNPAGYYGKYQFDLGTWQSVGGSGNPAEASESEQDYRASLLYERAGASPWPVCGS